MKKVALIYPPFSHKLFNENIEIVDKGFGSFPYISFGYVASEIKKAGWEVRLFDISASGQKYDDFLRELKDYAPDLLGYAAHAVQSFHDLLHFARRLREDFYCPTLVGGYEAKRYPLEVIGHDCFDYLCSGGAESFFSSFLDVFEQDGDLSSVPLLYYKQDGSILHTYDVPQVCFKDFDILDRSIFNNKLYYSHVSQRENFTIGLSSDGCPYNCSYCCMQDTSFKARSAKLIFDEMKQCSELYGIREMDWFDPVMLQSKRRILELVDLIEEDGLDMIWSCRSRIDSLTTSKKKFLTPDEHFIKRLSRGGCRRIFVGIESGDDEILKGIHKGATINPVRDVIKCANENGISILGFFMIGNPNETRETAIKTIEFSKTLGLDYAQYSMTIMKPHTPLYETYKSEILDHDYWKLYMEDKVEEAVLPRPWTELTHQEIMDITKKAYISFYFRPKYILKMLMKIESMTEFFRYASVAIRMALAQFNFKKLGMSRWIKLVFVGVIIVMGHFLIV
ncbi:MAG: radical SAM protein [Bacteriovoracaceae bacterium]|nr:radical SAM protein [Bacteriovoracaceae bacterium]